MKRIIASLFALIALFTLSGCAVMTGTSSTDFKTTEKADLVFIGLPAPLSWFAAGLQGTVFPVSPDTSLTAAHVAGPLLKQKRAQHQTCDVAAIARGNTGKAMHKLAYARAGSSVELYGYSAINSLPKSSFGKIAGFVRRDGCMYGLITGAGAVSGMSGGPVIDSMTGETVGVISNVVLFKGTVVFVPVQSFTNVLDRVGVPYRRY